MALGGPAPMMTLEQDRGGVEAAAEVAMGELISATHWRDCSFINLPLIYPSGDFVTVKIDRVESGFRVSDNGFAYREAESAGAEQKFSNVAKEAIKIEDLQRNARVIFVDVPVDHLSRAICDVAIASWRIADKLCVPLRDGEIDEIEDTLAAEAQWLGLYGAEPCDLTDRDPGDEG